MRLSLSLHLLFCLFAAVFSFWHKRPDKIPLSVHSHQLLPIKTHAHTHNVNVCNRSAAYGESNGEDDTMKNIIYIFIDAFPSSRARIPLTHSVCAACSCLSLSST